MNLDESKSQQLIDEIRQITVQYNAEVSRPRKSWPQALIRRVFELKETSGESWKTLSEQTGIPYFTLLKWWHRKKRELPQDGEFKAVTVAVTQEKLPIIHQKVATVTVTIDDRVRIEGLQYKDVADLLRRLKL